MIRSLLYRESNGVRHRRCSRCCEYLPESAFYIDSADGRLRSTCKECFQTDVVLRKRRRPFDLQAAWAMKV